MNDDGDDDDNRISCTIMLTMVVAVWLMVQGGVCVHCSMAQCEDTRHGHSAVTVDERLKFFVSVPDFTSK